MRWRRRTPRLPAEARAALRLARGERVLAAARLRDGSWLATTDQGLVHGEWHVPWSSATHAQWYAEAATLDVTWVDDAGERHDRSLVLAEPGRVPETVHERVVASIVLTRRLRVGEGFARVVARRQPGSDVVLWQVVPEGCIDLGAPEAREHVDATMRRMSDELGL